MKKAKKQHKRPICPKCGATINQLWFTESRSVIGILYKDGIHVEGDEDETERLTYDCLECQQPLFDDIDDALTFLETADDSDLDWAKREYGHRR